VIYHRGERRDHRVLRPFQSLLRFSGASAFSVCSAVKFKSVDAILLETMQGGTGEIGGTEKEHDWNISKEIVERVKKPVILAS